MARKIVISILLPIMIASYLAACNTEQVGSRPSESGIRVIATLFPQYDFARQITGGRADISLLLPPGMEPHAYESTPRDIADIRKADAFIYTGRFMEPWADRIIEGASSDAGVIVIDASAGVELMDESGDDNHDGKDPHIWLDLENAAIMVDNILDGLILADSANESYYRENAESYKKKLAELDARFAEAFGKVKSKTIIYGGHFAFGYFTKRYGLAHISPYSGFAPDAEPNSRRIAELVAKMKESGSGYIFYEELVEPRVARVIAEETGAEMLLLHGAHNISRDDLQKGVTFIDIMESNLEKLKQGLGYGE